MRIPFCPLSRRAGVSSLVLAGLIPLSSLSVFACGSTATTPPSDIESSAALCKVEVSVVSEDETETTDGTVDLGPRACLEPTTRMVMPRPRHRGDLIAVHLTIAETPDGAKYDAKVLALSADRPSPEIVDWLVPPGASAPPAKPVSPESLAPLARNAWVEIGKGVWPDGGRYKVEVRYTRVAGT